MRATLALAALVAFTMAACAPDKFRATDITGANFARELALTGHDGKPHTLADFRGKVVLVFFGFTHCPDICPSTLAQFAQTASNIPVSTNAEKAVVTRKRPARTSHSSPCG